MVPPHQLRDAVPAPVHVGLRHAEHDFAVFLRDLSQKTLEHLAPQGNGIVLFQQGHRIKPRVVPGMGVFLARVAQPHNQEYFLAHLCTTAFGASVFRPCAASSPLSFFSRISCHVLTPMIRQHSASAR